MLRFAQGTFFGILLSILVANIWRHFDSADLGAMLLISAVLTALVLCLN
jgi:hypothetical protein